MTAVLSRYLHADDATEELARDNGLEACDHILEVARGEVPTSLVNQEVQANPAFQEKLAEFKQRRAR